jgi:hypothetical protein
VANKPGHRGEHEVSRKTIRAGKAGVIRLNLWSTRALFVRTTAGAIGIRLSLRPLFSTEGEVDANLGRIAPRERERMSSRCLKFESDVSARDCEAR